MSFHEHLLEATSSARARFLATPILGAAVHGQISRASYLAFLEQAYHHVKHTSPLLMACGARLPERLEWLREAVAEYIEEECGHQKWILADIQHAGGHAEAVRLGTPSLATELMVAYAWDTIQRGNPVGFFGMVLVLEGTSVSLASMAADTLERTLSLPRKAFTYLRSHGELDKQHIGFFARLMDQLQDPADQQAVIHAARAFYQLYGEVFRALPVELTLAEAA